MSNKIPAEINKPAQPRPEYPRPILRRDHWLNLNGRWQFQPDPKDQGLKDQWFHETQFEDSIVVPFPIESEASEQHNLMPERVNWYHRQFLLPVTWEANILLHIGACDHWTRVFVNGQEVGQHRGGYVPIKLDISHAVRAGENSITIRVEDSDSWTQPRGKQAGTTKWPIDYDTVTGIWQTVWLEPVSDNHITSIQSEFTLETNTLTCSIESSRHHKGKIELTLVDDAMPVAGAEGQFDARAESKISLTIPDPKLWSPESPWLYTVKLVLFDENGVIIDTAESYTGLREIGKKDGAITINGQTIYLRGVLDQGYFEGGWYTALDDATIKRDVELTLSLGFNCARKHQKIEDPRYFYWADKLGLLVWEEMPSGRIFSNELVRTFTDEWMSVLSRDRQHPCIIAWVPFNESWGVWHQADRTQQRAFVDAMVSLTRTLDKSRLIVGNDGWEFSTGDLWTLHVYEGETGNIRDRISELMANPAATVSGGPRPRIGALAGADISGLPILLTECGGIGYKASNLEGDEFAYGELPVTEADLLERFESVAKTIADADQLCGFVWTQLTDVQQEVNGVLYFDRSPKLPMETIRQIMQSPGADIATPQ